jgi:hypothetical protein
MARYVAYYWECDARGIKVELLQNGALNVFGAIVLNELVDASEDQVCPRTSGWSLFNDE